MLSYDVHPLLHPVAFVSVFPRPLGALPSPEALVAGLRPDAPSPLPPPDDTLRAAVRDLLRHGGFKPTGRSKPASEYLARASAEGTLGAINLAVDVCNVVSLHSGFPISVVDLDRARAPFRVGIAAPDMRYIFNVSGQEIDIGGLLCLHDADGPCANAVKDAQRSKTTADTTRTVSVVWGTRAHAARVEAAGRWYRALLADHGAQTEPLPAA